MSSGARLSILLILVALAATASAEAWPGGQENPYQRTPINVSVDRTNLSAGEDGYEQALHRAFAWWAEGGNGALAWNASFAFVDDPRDAHVLVRFADRTRVACGNHSAAGCGLFGGADRPGEVRLALRGPPDDRPLPYETVGRIAKHEIGHALGLPHADDRDDIMHPSAERFAAGDPAPLDARWGWWKPALGALALAVTGVGGWRVWRWRTRAR